MFREVLGLPVETGCILGHGFSAEVAEIRGDVAGVEVGDRVITVATGANAEYIKIVRLFGSWAWTPEELARASRLISSGKIDRKPLISHTFSLEDADKAHETQLQEEEAIKVVLTP
jgi:threonine dehydrogenase-like Zn-dependent dehydrogenase